MGQFGQVYLADMNARVSKDKSIVVRTAVKTLRGGATPADREEFVREAEVWYLYYCIAYVSLLRGLVKINHLQCFSEEIIYG